MAQELVVFIGGTIPGALSHFHLRVGKDHNMQEIVGMMEICNARQQ